ncbi:unnamed protein product [Urochloa humidicola]
MILFICFLLVPNYISLKVSGHFPSLLPLHSSCSLITFQGLGRNFLRHLRRTRVIVHVVNAAADDPVHDYKIIREELRMYNPQYLERPYVVVLNKIDLPKEVKDIIAGSNADSFTSRNCSPHSRFVIKRKICW